MLETTLPDLIKKTAAHKLVWLESPYYYDKGVYYAHVSKAYLLKLFAKDKEITLSLIKKVYNHTIETIETKNLDSQSKKKLKRLYRYITLLSPSSTSGHDAAVKRFHRVLRAL